MNPISPYFGARFLPSSPLHARPRSGAATPAPEPSVSLMHSISHASYATTIGAEKLDEDFVGDLHSESPSFRGSPSTSSFDADVPLERLSALTPSPAWVPGSARPSHQAGVQFNLSPWDNLFHTGQIFILLAQIVPLVQATQARLHALAYDPKRKCYGDKSDRVYLAQQYQQLLGLIQQFDNAYQQKSLALEPSFVESFNEVFSVLATLNNQILEKNHTQSPDAAFPLWDVKPSIRNHMFTVLLKPELQIQMHLHHVLAIQSDLKNLSTKYYSNLALQMSQYISEFAAFKSGLQDNNMRSLISSILDIACVLESKGCVVNCDPLVYEKAGEKFNLEAKHRDILARFFIEKQHKFFKNLQEKCTKKDSLKIFAGTNFDTLQKKLSALFLFQEPRFKKQITFIFKSALAMSVQLYQDKKAFDLSPCLRPAYLSCYQLEDLIPFLLQNDLTYFGFMKHAQIIPGSDNGQGGIETDKVTELSVEYSARISQLLFAGTQLINGQLDLPAEDLSMMRHVMTHMTFLMMYAQVFKDYDQEEKMQLFKELLGPYHLILPLVKIQEKQSKFEYTTLAITHRFITDSSDFLYRDFLEKGILVNPVKDFSSKQKVLLKRLFELEGVPNRDYPGFLRLFFQMCEGFSAKLIDKNIWNMMCEELDPALDLREWQRLNALRKSYFKPYLLYKNPKNGYYVLYKFDVPHTRMWNVIAPDQTEAFHAHIEGLLAALPQNPDDDHRRELEIAFSGADFERYMNIPVMLGNLVDE